MAKQGLNQGVLSGAGIGTAIPGALQAMTPTMPTPEEYRETYAPATPFQRGQIAAPEGYQPGISGERRFFDQYSVPIPARLAEGGQVSGMDPRYSANYTPSTGNIPGWSAVGDWKRAMQAGQFGSGIKGIQGLARMMSGTMPPAAAASAAPAMQMQYTAAPEGYQPGVDPEHVYRRMVPKMAGGGMLSYTPAGMDQPMRMQAGGIADMMPGAQPEMPPMNDKDIVQESIRAIKGEIPEQAAAVVLGQFLQQFGEEAFRKLVDDVQSGRADAAGGDMEGTVRGPGDGMDDLVPATMDDGSQDVLLSDGEFIVPADVVSGLGNGSTDAGAEELHRMMDRVRQERTGRTEQARQVAVGGLMPA
jgi:hypothetical protein